MSIRSTIDANKLASAIKGPGIDTRVWLSFARIIDSGLDPNEGIYADVELIPDGMKITCLIGSGYARNKAGVFSPLQKDDVVLVAIPNGNYDAGAVIISRVFSEALKPPDEFHKVGNEDITELTDKPTLVIGDDKALQIFVKQGAKIIIEIEKDASIDIKASGSGKINITGDSTIIIEASDVQLGNTASSAVARAGDMVSVVVPALVSPAGPVASANPALMTLTGGYQAIGQIMSGAGSIKG